MKKYSLINDMKRLFVLLIVVLMSIAARSEKITYTFAGITEEKIKTNGLIEDYTAPDSITPATAVTKPDSIDALSVRIVGMDDLEITYGAYNSGDKVLRFWENFLAAKKHVVLHFSNLTLGDTIELVASAKGVNDVLFTASNGAIGEDQSIVSTYDPSTDISEIKTITYFATSSEAAIEEINGGFRIYSATISRFQCSEATEYLIRDTLYTCEGDTFYIQGRRYIAHTDTIIEDSLVTLYGCDSIMKTYVTVYPRYKMYELVPIAVGDTSIFYKGMHLTLGDNPVYFTTVDGCDSIWHYMVQEDETITNGESEVNEITTHSVQIKWMPDSTGLVSQYEIDVYHSLMPIAHYEVDAHGKLMAPSVARMRRDTTYSTDEYFVLTITGLEAGTNYYYTITGTSREYMPIYRNEGSFTTTKEEQQGIFDPVADDPDKPRKILYEGKIYILRGDKTYTLTGQKVK